VTLLDQALAYAAVGWPVFPCRPGQKIPATQHGCLDATCDPELIRSWWKSMPTANLAIATGTPGPDVVDIDRKPDRDGIGAMERVRRAGLLAGPLALVSTPSRGLHLYYWGSTQGNGKLPRHGIDFRGRGGYVLAPPSIVGGKPYQLLERRRAGLQVDWSKIRRFLEPPRQTPRLADRTDAEGSSLDRLAAWVAGQLEGNRNDGLFWAACRAVEAGYTESDLDALVTAAIVAGLPEPEARRTIRSVMERAHG
jgi:Bifunctional DNA primase/polymerase, N-terminal/Primase C terminal 1 (PriCT-1)